jgi:CubicO group peptidase (beta-lactamase class C family)
VIASGIVLERAVGKTLAAYLQDKLWRPFGMAQDAYWNLEAPGGHAFANSGICASLRDWARFGLFMLREGVLRDGTELLPDGWIAEAITPSSASLRASAPYGFNWWRPDPACPSRMNGSESCYSARGSAGQRILINPAKKLVICKWAVWGNGQLTDMGAPLLYEDEALFASIVERLRESV